MNNSKDGHPERKIPRKVEVKATSGKNIIFHKISIRNSGASSGDVSGKLLEIRLQLWKTFLYEVELSLPLTGHLQSLHCITNLGIMAPSGELEI